METEDVFLRKRAQIGKEWEEYSQNHPFSNDSLRLRFLFEKLASIEANMDYIIEYLKENKVEPK